ncbi:IPT/TIG domain-containing protein [Nocardioides humilatus]|uniref:IPT/TIG domain-containing protein n=1 Tax=Nocardioides humilatus TaxID=2607660 RepID=UPI00165FA531|nr:IPT/TIG domain-containing protein [Nocardioides humilatus]
MGSLLAALAVTGLSAPSATAAGDDADVDNISSLAGAAGTCTGTGADATVITLTGDIDAPSDQVTVNCYAVIDLAGFDLTVRNIAIGTLQTLTIRDGAAIDGTLTANAASASNVAAIRTSHATLVVDGGTVTATGGGYAAGIGSSAFGVAGTTTINGGTVTTMGGFSAAGIGGGYYSSGGITTISGGTLAATGGDEGTGIGGGSQSNGGTTTIDGGTVTATGGDYAAGIGGGSQGGGGTTTITQGTVTATGGYSAAGIGGGSTGAGGNTTVNGGTVTASGGAYGAGIGGGDSGMGGSTTLNAGTVTVTGGFGAAGIGGGLYASGASTSINGGTVTATAGSDGSGSAVGAGGYGTQTFGLLTVAGGVLRLPSGSLQVFNSAVGAEVVIGPDGVIDGSDELNPSYAAIIGSGQIANGGRILLPKTNVTDNGTPVLDRHYRVSFDTQGGSTAPDAVTVFADTFDHGNRVFPDAPTMTGLVFAGWNTAVDGTGDSITASSTLPGSSASGTPVQMTAYAQWAPIPAPVVTGISPVSGPIADGTEVTITGTDFTAATRVDFGSTGPATSFVVDSSTQITAYSPEAPSPVVRHVLVTTPSGSSAPVAGDRFTYTGPAPTITHVTPSSGPTAGNTVVVIEGSGFTGATKVRFGTAGLADFQVDSPTQITATSPASTTVGVRHIRVTRSGGTSAAVPSDRFTYNSPPTITAIDPHSGTRDGGTVVMIYGTGFVGVTNVVFGTAGQATFSVVSPTVMTATSPPSTTSGTRHIRITTHGGTSTAVFEDRFVYEVD